MRRGARKRRRVTGWSVTLGTLLAGSLLLPPTIGPSSAASSDSASAVTPDTLLYDDALALVGERFPEFAGMYLDEDAGKLFIQLTDTDSSVVPQIHSLLAVIFGESLARLTPEVEPAEYSFAELNDWKESIAPVAFAMPSIVFVDLDELENRVVIGLSDIEADAEPLRTQILRQGVPESAFDITFHEPAGPELRELRRPMVGGLQLHWTQNNSTWMCSLGFIADRGGARGIVTNSHCSRVVGGVDTTDYGQNTMSSVVARESVDPATWTGIGCYTNWRCRYSDANFAGVTSIVHQTSRGIVARPGTFGTVFPWQWDGVSQFRIVNKGTPGLGTNVTKVGRTTGATSGNVSRTCVDVGLNGTNVAWICQSQAGYSGSGGDSGGPVLSSATGNNRSLFGIHWGANGWFSPWNNIRWDFGNMTVCESTAC